MLRYRVSGIASDRNSSQMPFDIASASQEQSTGVEQVTAAVTQMDRVTHSNSAEAAKLTSTAHNIEAVALDSEHVRDACIRDALAVEGINSESPDE